MQPNLSRCLRGLALLCLAAAAPAFPKGILVRFLAGGPDDSAARYDVYRHAAGSAPARIGSLPAVPGADTVAFPDTGARKGVAYGYAVRAVDPSGRESDFSDTTLAAIPMLALPDTLRATAWPAIWILPASAHPLRGTADLAVEAVQPGPLTLAYDAASGRLEFRGPAGGDTLRVALRGSYFGKFSDADTVVIAVSGAAPTSLPAAPDGSAGAVAGFGRAPGFSRARDAGGRLLPVLVLRKGGAPRLYDAAGRSSGALPPR